MTDIIREESKNKGNLKDKAAKGFLWSGLNNGAMQVLNAVFGIILAQQLNQEDYGLIGMLTVFTLIANSLQDSGFVISLTNKRDATHSDYNSVFWFNIVVSITIYIILYTCAPLIAAFFDEPILTSLSRYYFFGFVIASLSIVPRAILFRHIKQKELAIMGITSLLVSGSVGVTMAYCGMAYWGLATQTLVFNIMVTTLSWILSQWKPSRKVSLRPIKEMFGFSSKMLITNIFNQINNNIFSILLGRLYTKVEVGTYTQANKWNTMGASTITGMVQGVAQPTFVQVGNDDERLRRTEDNDMHYRMHVAGYKFFFSPEIISYHAARSTMRGQLRQKWGNGYWIGRTMRIQPRCFAPRHLIPAAFVLSLALCLLMLPASVLPLLAVLIPYLLCDLVFAVKGALSQDHGRLLALVTLPILFPAVHVVYGLGTLAGLIHHPSK